MQQVLAFAEGGGVSRFGNALRRPSKAITQQDARTHLLMLLTNVPDAILASHDEYSLGRMFRVPLKTIAADLAAERTRRAGEHLL